MLIGLCMVFMGEDGGGYILAIVAPILFAGAFLYNRYQDAIEEPTPSQQPSSLSPPLPGSKDTGRTLEI